MKIILIRDMKDLGVAGDVVVVKNGYARNYLLPKQYAVMATRDALKKIEAIKEKAVALKNTKVEEIKAKIASLVGVELSFARKADDDGNLYGSVSEFDVVSALAEKSIKVNKMNIVMEKHIKVLGETEVTLDFGSDLTTTVKVTVGQE